MSTTELYAMFTCRCCNYWASCSSTENVICELFTKGRPIAIAISGYTEETAEFTCRGENTMEGV